MCTMIPNLTSGQRLMAESQHMSVEVRVAADKLDRLEAENVKLRELVETMRVDMREMLDIIVKSSDVCGYCRYYAERLDVVEGIMRELRIEV